MAKGFITMSRTEVDRLGIIKNVVEKKIKQKQAANRLGLSVRQIKRLVRRYRLEGVDGLLSRRRGRSPSNTIPAARRKSIMKLVRKKYTDFGPTLACEKLTEIHGDKVSVETLRQWMIADGLWESKKRRRARIHQRRPRRSCLGDLVQIDGSPHDWFEERGPRCTLIVFIDDATSRLMALRFVPTETTDAYMETLSEYLDHHGRPVAIYSDKHSIFRNNKPDQDGKLTQFTRMLKTLDIEPIHANTPQAKGRVERANQTLQDRLVKELRLQGINDIDAANIFLPDFLPTHNDRFAVLPQSPHDAHRPVLHSPEELSLILSKHHTRILSKNLAIQFKNREYQLQGQGKGYRLRGAHVTVCETSGGMVTILYQGRQMPFRILTEGEPPIPLDDEKSVHQHVEQAKNRQDKKNRWKPAPDHPWRRPFVSKTQLPESTAPLSPTTTKGDITALEKRGHL